MDYTARKITKNETPPASSNDTEDDVDCFNLYRSAGSDPELGCWDDCYVEIDIAVEKLKQRMAYRDCKEEYKKKKQGIKFKSVRRKPKIIYLRRK